MDLIEEILSLTDEVKNIDREDKSVKLPQNAYYLKNNRVVCFEREKGESRFPYDSDGLVVWARSNGYIEASESTFEIFKTELYNGDPSVAFFTGIPYKDGMYYPLSVFGVNRQMFEPYDVLRYVVYSFKSAFYIAETDNIISAVRLYTDKDKNIHFSYAVINKSGKIQKIYIADYFKPWLSCEKFEDFFARMNRYGEYNNGHYLISNDEDYLVARINITHSKVEKEYHTTGQNRFYGVLGRQLLNAVSLKEGIIKDQTFKTNTTDIPVAADIFHFDLSGNDYARIDYSISYCHSKKEAEELLKICFNSVKLDKDLNVSQNSEIKKINNLNIEFSDFGEGLNVNVFNRFIKNVQKQVNLCALGKNYAGSLIGIRDVMQQIESCLMWQPNDCREKIIVVLNNILEDGRPPRQFSFPTDNRSIPTMDLRKFIDQGNWIISVVYTYLSFTGDFSVLDEKCGYYIPDDNNETIVARSDVNDTVLAHLIKIMDFLSSNLDKDNTDCLKALYGDWNDALNGLGVPRDKTKEFGNGVSVMASLHYYQNCREMCEILSYSGDYDNKISEYKEYQRKIKSGLQKYAVEKDDTGKKRIIHGWGDGYSYKIGSFNDPDGIDRVSSTANSFWALSGMIENDISLKESLLEAFERLDSKYGFVTFDKPFELSMEKYVGRIAKITHGTYENNASYIHSSTFAIMALFAVGESKKAWDALKKIITVTHDNCTLTPFVMPNSYCFNEEYSIDGESMGDWYTGSGTVLIKCLVKYAFGLAADLNGVKIQTAKYFPCKEASITALIKGKRITLNYSDKSSGKREIFINNKTANTVIDKVSNVSLLYLKNSEINDETVIDVID